MTARRVQHRTAVAVGAVLAVLMLAGCAAAVAPGAASAPPTTRVTVAPSSTPTPAPSLRPGGSAAQNLPYFAHVIAGYVATVGRGERAQLIAHLGNASFATSGWRA